MKSKTKELFHSTGAAHRRRTSSRRRIADEAARINLSRRVHSTDALPSPSVASSSRPASASDFPPIRLPPDPKNSQQAFAQSQLQVPPQYSSTTSQFVQDGSNQDLGAQSADVLTRQSTCVKRPQRHLSRRSVRTASAHSATHLAFKEESPSSQASIQSTLAQPESGSVYLDASQHLPVPTPPSEKPTTISSASTKSLQQSPTTYYDAAQTAPPSSAGMLARPVYAQLTFRFMAPQVLEPRQSELDVLDSSLLHDPPTIKTTSRSGGSLASGGEQHESSNGSVSQMSTPESLDRFQTRSPPSSSAHGSTEAISGVVSPSPSQRPAATAVAERVAERRRSSAISSTSTAPNVTDPGPLVECQVLRTMLDKLKRVPRALNGSAWNLLNDRGKKRISTWSLQFTSKGVEAKYRSYSQRIAQFPLSVLGWGLLLPIGFQAHISSLSASRLQKLLDSCSSSTLNGNCVSCQTTVTYGLGASTILLLCALLTPKSIVRTRSILFSAVFVLLLLLNVASTICPGTCVDAQGGIVFGPLSTASELPCLQAPEAVSASTWLSSTLPYWLTSGTVSAYVILAATPLMLRHAFAFGSLVLVVLVVTQVFATANTASYLSTMSFAFFEVLVKSTLATYQRELITRISFFLNVSRSGLQKHLDAMAAAAASKAKGLEKASKSDSGPATMPSALSNHSSVLSYSFSNSSRPLYQSPTTELDSEPFPRDAFPPPPLVSLVVTPQLETIAASMCTLRPQATLQKTVDAPVSANDLSQPSHRLPLPMIPSHSAALQPDWQSVQHVSPMPSPTPQRQQHFVRSDILCDPTIQALSITRNGGVAKSSLRRGSISSNTSGKTTSEATNLSSVDGLLDDLVLQTLPRKRLLSNSPAHTQPPRSSEHAINEPPPSTHTLLDSYGRQPPFPGTGGSVRLEGINRVSPSLATVFNAPRQAPTDTSRLVPILVKTASHAVSSCSFATESDESDAPGSTSVTSRSGSTANSGKDSSTSSDLPTSDARARSRDLNGYKAVSTDSKGFNWSRSSNGLGEKGTQRPQRPCQSESQGEQLAHSALSIKIRNSEAIYSEPAAVPLSRTNRAAPSSTAAQAMGRTGRRSSLTTVAQTAPSIPQARRRQSLTHVSGNPGIQLSFFSTPNQGSPTQAQSRRPSFHSSKDGAVGMSPSSAININLNGQFSRSPNSSTVPISASHWSFTSSALRSSVGSFSTDMNWSAAAAQKARRSTIGAATAAMTIAMQRQRRRCRFLKHWLHGITHELFYSFPSKTDEDKYRTYASNKLVNRFRLSALSSLVVSATFVAINIMIRILDQSFSVVPWLLAVFVTQPPDRNGGETNGWVIRWWTPYVIMFAINCFFLAVSLVGPIRTRFMELFAAVYAISYVTIVIFYDHAVWERTRSFANVYTSSQHILAAMFTITTLRLRPAIHGVVLCCATIGMGIQVGNTLRRLPNIELGFGKLMQSWVIVEAIVVSGTLSLFFEAAQRRWYYLRNLPSPTAAASKSRTAVPAGKQRSVAVSSSALGNEQ